jgi:hypothetical protein
MGWFFPKILDSCEIQVDNTVLGFSPNLNREKYAATPIIEAMQACNDLGAVSVAMVPPALGKTTAAKLFLRRNKDAVRGIAFCRRRKGMPYVSEMLRLLGLSTTNPPSGWLSCLVDALRFPSQGDNRRSYLILDEFVNEPEDLGDTDLVEELKSLLRNTEILILLTPSEPYANYLWTRNNLQGIVPLSGTFPVGTYPSGQWQSMYWSVNTIKIAGRQDPCFKKISSDQIDRAVDDYMARLSGPEPRKVTYLKVKAATMRRLAIAVAFLYSQWLSLIRFLLTTWIILPALPA